MHTKVTAFFMTGTGNSYKVAKWFLAAADKLQTELCQVKEQQEKVSIGINDLLVLCYPTHGFTAPWLMIKHVFRLPSGNGRHAVLLPARAGTRIRGVALPGMEGTAGYLIALLLWLRGYKIKSVAAIDMPSNWTAVHWGLSAKNVSAIAEKAEAKVTRIAHEILAGRSFFRGFIPLLFGLLLARISFMYLIIGQLFLAKLFFADDTCTGCSLCRKICPKQAVVMIGGKPHWTYGCDSCMACMNYCPQQSIQVSPLTVFLFAYVLSFPVTAWITGKLGPALPANLPATLQFLIQYVYILGSVALVSRLLHYVLQLKPVASFIAALSHTKYFRRYRAPGVSLNDIHKENTACAEP